MMHNHPNYYWRFLFTPVFGEYNFNSGVNFWGNFYFQIVEKKKTDLTRINLVPHSIHHNRFFPMHESRAFEFLLGINVTSIVVLDPVFNWHGWLGHGITLTSFKADILEPETRYYYFYFNVNTVHSDCSLFFSLNFWLLRPPLADIISNNLSWGGGRGGMGGVWIFSNHALY